MTKQANLFKPARRAMLSIVANAAAAGGTLICERKSLSVRATFSRSCDGMPLISVFFETLSGIAQAKRRSTGPELCRRVRGFTAAPKFTCGHALLSAVFPGPRSLSSGECFAEFDLVRPSPLTRPVLAGSWRCVTFAPSNANRSRLCLFRRDRGFCPELRSFF